MGWFRFKRFLLVVALWLLHWFFVIFILLQLPSVQSVMTRTAIQYFAEHYGLKLSIEKVYVNFPNKIVFGGVYLEDMNHDTLIYANELYTKISAVKIMDSKIYVDRLVFNEAYLNLYVDTAGVNNMDFLIKKFTSNDTTSSGGFDIFCNEFEFENSRFDYNDRNAPIAAKGLDVKHISLDNFNVWISDFQMYADTIELDLNEFSFYDRSGLNIEELSAHIKYNPKGIDFDQLVFRTSESILLCHKAQVEGTDDDYMSDPFKKMKVNLQIDTCRISLRDISLFMPDVLCVDEYLAFQGNLKGKLSDIKLKDFSFLYGENTRLDADISCSNLENFSEAFVFADISNLSTSVNEVEHLMQCFTSDPAAKLPENIHALGLIRYQGNITGMINDLVTYGSLSTDAGDLKTDMALSYDMDKEKIAFNGKIDVYDLHLGDIIQDNKNFGNMSMNAKLKGEADSKGNFTANVDCSIDYIKILDYTYRNIDIEGDFSNALLLGEIHINDPNLKFNINGSYNTTGDEPMALLQMDIDANIDEVLADTSMNASVKLNMNADFRGDITEAVIGKLVVNDINVNYNEKIIALDAIKVRAAEENNQQIFTVKSDYLDLNLHGKYNFIEITQVFSSLVSTYLPSMVTENTEYRQFSKNDFTYDLHLKNLNSIFDFFIPQLRISDDWLVVGNMKSSAGLFTAQSQLPRITYDSISVDGGNFYISTNSNSIKLDMGSAAVNAGKLNIFNNLAIGLHAENDSIYLGMLWDDKAEPDYSGNVSLSAILKRKENTGKLLIFANIYESEININNTNWRVDETAIIIDTTDITIDNFVVFYGDQSLRIDDFLSEDKNKLLRFYIENTQLNNINPLIADLGYSLDGVLTASGRISGLYDTPVFKTNISVDQLTVNKEKFGRFDLSADWLNNDQGFRLMGSNPFLRFNGNYIVEKDLMNITAEIDNFKLEVLEPYLNTVDISDTKGFIDGRINITGTTKAPALEGFIDFERAQLTYDYLKLKVNLNDTVWITPNSILFNRFVVKDTENNTGTVNGGVYHDNFEDFRFAFDINTNNLKMLNTTEVDNSLFYGTAYGSGNVQIKGNISAFGIDVVIKTEPNTIFVLPMTESYEAGENTILTFIKSDTAVTDIASLTEKESDMSYYLNMDIELTPDAEAQIVFDPKVGDMIKANCKGNLNIYYDSNEDFKMIGEVEVVKGSYLFTLENVINKRFEVAEGGTIVWNGDPYDAVMNINAVYRLRAPLYDLMIAIDSSSTYKKLQNVECYISMTGSLMTPDIAFDIKVPNADDKVLSQLNNMSDDEKNKQLLYLLIMNRFYTPENMRPDYAQGRNASAVGNTASELLTNQLSNWLSQITKDFDIGVKYRPGDEISSQELEVALSTQLLNDRILINGNLGVGQHQSQASNIVGDFEVQVKINKKGNLRVKGFTRANKDLDMEYGPYTNGAGIFFTDEFNTIGDLFRKMIQWFVPDKKKKETTNSDKRKTTTKWAHPNSHQSMLLNMFYPEIRS